LTPLFPRGEIGGDRLGGPVAARRITMQKLGADPPKRFGAAVRQRRGCLPRQNQFFELSRVLRTIRPDAGQHLVEDHAHRPQIRMGVDVRGVQPLGRKIRKTAVGIARQLARQRQRLRDAEVEQLDLAAAVDPYVLRRDVAVDDRRHRFAIEIHLEGVRVGETLADLPGDVGGDFRAERPAREDFGQVLTIHELHGHVEASIEDAIFVDARNSGIARTEPLLQPRTSLLRLEDLARLGIVAPLDEAQRDETIRAHFFGEIDVRHAAAPELRVQPVLPERRPDRRLSSDHRDLP
jgi:hypothetical protein